MTLTLDPDLDRALKEMAEKAGMKPEDLALMALRERFAPREAETLEDFLEDHIGVLDSREHVSGGARMSEASDEKFTEGLLAQHRRESR